MRCKPGVMARIVKSIDQCTTNIVGETVMVLRIVARYDDGDVAWSIGCGKKLTCNCGSQKIVAYPDSCLEPIEPPKDDAVDEMVKLVGPAKKIEIVPIKKKPVTA